MTIGFSRFSTTRRFSFCWLTSSRLELIKNLLNFDNRIFSLRAKIIAKWKTGFRSIWGRSKRGFPFSFLLSLAQLFYCLNLIVFHHFIPHGSLEDKRKTSCARQKKLYRNPPLVNIMNGPSDSLATEAHFDVCHLPTTMQETAYLNIYQRTMKPVRQSCTMSKIVACKYEIVSCMTYSRYFYPMYNFSYAVYLFSCLKDVGSWTMELT